jgi:hypothetical protein
MALTADVHTIRYGTPGNSTQPTAIGLTASATVYRGSVATTRSGYLVAASSPQSTDLVWGMIAGVDEGSNNGTVIDGQPGITGGTTNGSVTVSVETGSFWLSQGTGGDAIAASNLGATVYLINETTVGLTSNGNTRPVAGTVLKTSDPLNVLSGLVAVKLGPVAGSTGGPS